MTIRLIEQGVPRVGDDGQELGAYAGVRVEGTFLTVKWMCGDKRTFTADSMREALATVETFAKFPDVWVTLKDLNGYNMALRVADGYLYGDSKPSEDATRVSWRSMRKAIKTALRDPVFAPEPAAEPTADEDPAVGLADPVPAA